MFYRLTFVAHRGFFIPHLVFIEKKCIFAKKVRPSV